MKWTDPGLKGLMHQLSPPHLVVSLVLDRRGQYILDHLFVTQRKMQVINIALPLTHVALRAATLGNRREREKLGLTT